MGLGVPSTVDGARFSSIEFSLTLNRSRRTLAKLDVYGKGMIDVPCIWRRVSFLLYR